MKLFIYYDEIAACDTTIKIKLPKKWRDGPVANLKETFIEHFNKKHPAQRLVFSDAHVLCLGGTVLLADDAVVSKYFKNGDYVCIKTGAPPASAAGSGEKETDAEDGKEAGVEEADAEDDNEAGVGESCADIVVEWQVTMGGARSRVAYHCVA